MALLYRLAPVPLLLFLLLLLVATDFDSYDVVNNDWETKTFFRFLPWDDNAK